MTKSDPVSGSSGTDIKPGLGVLLATCISALVVNANTSAVSILLPSIGEDVGAPVSTLQWAVTGYSLVGAAFIVTAGALGDVFGRRRIFLGGLALFIVSCALIAMTDTAAGVIGGRAIQGAAGSTILACGLSLLSVASSGAERLRAVSYWGAASAIGAAAGPLVGGVLVDTAGWQALFWIDAGIAALCVPMTLRRVEESLDPNRSRSIDWLGTFLVAAILAPFILAVSKGSEWGWTSPATLGSFLVSIVAAIAFVYAERRSDSPLVDLDLMKNRPLIGATLGILIGAGTINGLMFVFSLYFQDPATLGMTALQAGLATLPATVGLVILAPLVPRFATKMGTRQVVGLGFVIMTVGFAVLIGVSSSWQYAAFVFPVDRRCRRHGPVEWTVLVGRHQRGSRRAGRLRLRDIQHGPLCGSRGVDRSGRHPLRRCQRRPGCRRRLGWRRPGGRGRSGCRVPHDHLCGRDPPGMVGRPAPAARADGRGLRRRCDRQHPHPAHSAPVLRGEGRGRGVGRLRLVTRRVHEPTSWMIVTPARRQAATRCRQTMARSGCRGGTLRRSHFRGPSRPSCSLGPPAPSGPKCMSNEPSVFVLSSS